jgi:hypothetical protein
MFIDDLRRCISDHTPRGCGYGQKGHRQEEKINSAKTHSNICDNDVRGGGSSIASGIPKTDLKSKLLNVLKESEEQRRVQQQQQ